MKKRTILIESSIKNIIIRLKRDNGRITFSKHDKYIKDIYNKLTTFSFINLLELNYQILMTLIGDVEKKKSK
jgi:hypothetical protein